MKYSLYDNRCQIGMLFVGIQQGSASKDIHRSIPTVDGKDKPVYRFKGFDSAVCGDSMSALEAIVNAWIEAEHPRIRHVCQSMRGEHILLSFVYEETREQEQRVTTNTQASVPAFPRFFDDDLVEDQPTGGRIPATPPPMH